jgi:hypothetical protein
MYSSVFRDITQCPFLLWLNSLLLGPDRFFSFLNLCTVGLLGRGISPSQSRSLHRRNAHGTSMPWVGYESTVRAFERAKTVHAIDRPATVNSITQCSALKFNRRVGGTVLHLQGLKNKLRKKSSTCHLFSRCFLSWFVPPWRWRRNVPPIYWLSTDFTELFDRR